MDAGGGAIYVSLISCVGVVAHHRHGITIVNALLDETGRRELIACLSAEKEFKSILLSSDDLKFLKCIIRDARSLLADQIGFEQIKPSPPRNALRLEEVYIRSSECVVDWNNLRRFLEEHGYSISSVSPVSYDPASVINSSVILPKTDIKNPEQKIISSGCSLNVSQAINSALAEAAERTLATDITKCDLNVFFASADDLADRGFIVPVLDVAARDAYTTRTVIDWVLAYTLDNKPAAMPAEKVFFDYIPQAGVKGFALQTTCGLAAEATLQKAVWAALKEVIERDAYMIAMMVRPKYPTIDNIILDNIAPNLVKQLHDSRLHLVLKDISLDWPLCIVHAMIITADGRLPSFSHGTGSALNWPEAALKATTESLQLRSGLANLAQDMTAEIVFPTHYGTREPALDWCDPLSRSALAHLIEGDASLYKMDDKLTIEEVIENIKANSLEVFWCHLGTFFGLEVVRVVVPTCILPNRDHGYMPKRLKLLIQKLDRHCAFEGKILT